MTRILINLLLIFFLSNSLFANDNIKLIHADEMEGKQNTDGNVKIVSGNVLFRKGEIELECEKAFWYEHKNQIDFYEKVIVTNKDKKITSDSLSYYYKEDRILAYGNPVVVDSNRTIKAEKLEYFTELDIVKAIGNVDYSTENNKLLADFLTYYADSGKTMASKNCQFIDLKENNILKSDSILYFNDDDKLYAYINPILIKKDSTGKEISRIEGKIISGESDKAKFISIGNVKITQEEIIASGDSANYNDSTGVLILTGNPKVINKDQTIKGNEIKATMSEGKIQNLFVLGSAIVTANSIAYLPIPENDTLQTIRDSVKVRDEMAGNLMEIYFEEGDIDSICISGMATNYYNVLEDSILQGVNSASGDTVIMNFTKKELNEISIIGGTQGKFIPHKTNKSMDTTVVYAAERIDYFIETRKTDLFQNASVKFGDSELTAGMISVLWNDNLLYAFPEDTTQIDSIDSTYPKMTQKGRDPFVGSEIVYNIKTRRGRILNGKTDMDDGIYYGKNIKKKGKKTFYIEDGIYTTCDAKHPHFHFKSNKMKMIQKDKIFARPIVMYIHDIPLLALPFAVIPNKGGKRHSGWIMPTYGNNNNSGNFLRGLGYFWDINDYTDLKMTGDFFDKKGIRINLKNRYKIRYKVDGSIFLSLHDMMLQDYPERVWRLNINHNHKISPTSSFRANGRFVSNDQYMRKNGLSQEARLQQQLISNATFSKSWRNTPYSMSGNLSQTINLQSKEKIKITPTREGLKQSYINRTLPSVSFRKSTARLVPLKKSQSATDAKWYNDIRYSFNSKLTNKQDIYYMSAADIDSFLWEEKNELKNGIQNNISISSTQKIFSYFAVNQSMSIREDWLFELDEPLYDENNEVEVDEHNEIKTITKSGFFPRHTGNMSVGINTKIYGLLPIKLGALQAIRHVLTPSVSLNYRPDFTEEVFGWNPGYVEQYLDTNDVERTYDPFRSTLIGSTPSGESKSMSISLRNTFQAKTEKNGEENKFDLFSMNINFSHNFAADSLKLSTIRTSIRTKLNKLNFDFSMTHDPYKYRNGRVDEWNDTFHFIPIPRLTSVSASTGISLKSSDFGNKEPMPDDSTQYSGENKSQDNRKASNLWSMNMNFRYSLSEINPDIRNERFNLSLNAKLNLTKNWKIGYSASVDLMERKLFGQRFTVERDLHCWEMSLSWTPTGYGSGGMFMIRAKAPTLQDLKWKKPSGNQRGTGFSDY